MSWGHSLEFWNPSGGLSHSLVIITTRNAFSPLGGAREQRESERGAPESRNKMLDKAINSNSSKNSGVYL